MLLPGIVHFISGVTHMENDLLFCSILKLMFTNGKIIVYKFIIQFYSYLYFCQKYAWTKLPDVCQYEGKKNPTGIKLQYFCQYGNRKKNQSKNNL
jgi:hypothetical protein